MITVEIVEVDDRGRILVHKKLRKKYGIEPGKKVLLVERKDGILITPVNLSLERLSTILKDIHWGRESRRRAEKWLLEKSEKS